MTVTACASVFATRIMGRHRRLTSEPASLPQILRRGRVITLHRTVNATFPLNLAPRIRLEHDVHRVEAGARLMVRTAHDAALRIVERVFARSGRQPVGRGVPPVAELARLLGVASNRPNGPPAEPSPVSRVLWRPPSAQPATSIRQAQDSAVASWPAPEPATVEPAESLSVAELDRVATHVVQRLDRRLAAWRERTGRI